VQTPATSARLASYVRRSELTETLERHYCAQLRRYYNANDISQHNLDITPAPTDPPF